MTKGHQIIVGDVLDQLKNLPDNWVHCVVTSPPYFGLRDYGTAQWSGGDPLCDHSPGREGWAAKSTLQGSKETQDHRMDGFPGRSCPKCGAQRVDLQIGHEDTPDLYVDKLVKIFNEVRRVLRKDGTLWLNLGDSYWGSWGNSGNRPQLDGESRGQRERKTQYMERPGYDEHRRRPASSYKVPGLKNKDLVGIPWMVAFALRRAGWWIRSEIIWFKKNGMPESVEDRPAKAHETIFLLTKSDDYFYDHEAVKELSKDPERVRNDQFGGEKYKGLQNSPAGVYQGGETRNLRDVWHLSTVPSQVAHFAVFTPGLPLKCIKAGTSLKGCCAKCKRPWTRLMEDTGVEDESAKGSKFEAGKTLVQQPRHPNASNKPRTVKKTIGWVPDCKCGVSEVEPCIVLDIFHGSGTTGAVAEYLGMKYIGIELSQENAELYDQRCAEVRRHLIGGDAPDRDVSESQISLFQEEPK